LINSVIHLEFTPSLFSIQHSQ